MINIKALRSVMKIHRIEPRPRPLEDDGKKGFKNPFCKNYNLCLDYAIFARPKWPSFSCKACLWKCNKGDRPRLSSVDEPTIYLSREWKAMKDQTLRRNLLPSQH